ncbi:hypothetical protein [Arthrobacter sp. H5]|uniref:hypothetical protein n=1 Tax=Arthrobacter sp. H5 TaxID=1267973 RepID=UPI000484434F|nr:hypothetical protein [Arthrobacter sp. H5]
MTNAAPPLRTPILLVTAALIIAALGYAAFVFVGSLPPALGLISRAVSVVLPTALLGVAIALLLRRNSSARYVTPWIFTGHLTLSAACALMFSLGFSAGMDDTDAGRPQGFLSAFALPAGIVGVLSAGVALALLLAMLLERGRMSRSAQLSVAIIAGVVATAPVFVLLLNPSSTALLAFVLLIGLIMQSLSKPKRDAAIPMVQPQSRAMPVQLLGAFSLVILAVVWGVGAFVGFSEAGQPTATTAMGVSAAAATLAALPVILGGAAVGHMRMPQLAWRRYSGIALAGVIAGTVIQLVGYDTGGSALFISAGVAGLSVGTWVALTLLPAMPPGWPPRLATFGGMALGGCLAWFMTVPLTGGIALVIPAAALLCGGKALSAPSKPEV